MHRCARAAAGAGLCRVVVWSSRLVAFVVCVIFVLPFFLLVVLDELVGERAAHGHAHRRAAGATAATGRRFRSGRTEPPLEPELGIEAQGQAREPRTLPECTRREPSFSIS